MGVLRLDLALAKLISKNMLEGARAGLVGWWVGGLVGWWAGGDAQQAN